MTNITHAKVTLNTRIQGMPLVPSPRFEPAICEVSGVHDRELFQKDLHHVQQSAK